MACGIIFMTGQLQHKAEIESFWNQFGGKKSNGHGFGKETKLAALVRMAGLKIHYRNHESLSVKRQKFDESKSVLHKMNTRRNEVCFACGLPATARHHVIQLQNGGINSRKNVISLCDGCHAHIHPWLLR